MSNESERAAFEHNVPLHELWADAAALCHRVQQGSLSPDDLAAHIRKKIDAVIGQARAASASETGAEGAIYQILTEEGAWLDVPQKVYDRTKSDPTLTRVVYRMPVRAAQEVSDWQPIATAPKDGTEILLSNGTVVQQGWWIHDEGGTTEHRDMDGRYIGQTDSDGYIGWWDVSGGMQPEPDRWMPMPEAPRSPAMAAEAEPRKAGYVLVPVEPTQAMLDRGYWPCTQGRGAKSVWGEMLRAIPAAPQPAEADAREGLTDERRIELAIFHRILGKDGNGDATRSYGSKDDVIGLCRAIEREVLAAHPGTGD